MVDEVEMEVAQPPPPPAETVQHPKKRRRCVCATAEACFSCRRCLEQHCVCGAAQHASARGLCRESRACNCRVLAPTSSRCELCMGCRQTGNSALSHCRCIAHQQLWRAQKDEKKATVEDDTCYCFEDKRFQANRVDPLHAKERRHAISLVKRRAGLPTSRGLYTKKITAPSVGVDEFGEECVELSDCDLDESYVIKPTGAEELEDAVYPVYLERSRPVDDGHVPQKPLSWSRSEPYQQAMAAPPTRHVRAGTNRAGQNDVGMQEVTLEAIDRSLANAVFERDRDGCLPPEDLVDYLILTASVKASRIPELLGSLDDTAATAVGIVVEEYMKQLVLRSACESLTSTTKKSVQAFAGTVLHDFDYTIYLQQCELPALTQLSVDQTNQVVDNLTHLVYDEFMALQPPSYRTERPPNDQVFGYIREVIYSDVDSAKFSVLEATNEPAKLDIASLEKLKAVKLSQHFSKVTGQRIYKYEVAADVGGKHCATIALDGFESRAAAEQSIKRMRRVLEDQDKRLSELENPVVPPTVEDPRIAELYEQLLNQVRQSRTTQQATNTPPSTRARRRQHRSD